MTDLAGAMPQLGRPFLFMYMSSFQGLVVSNVQGYNHHMPNRVRTAVLFGLLTPVLLAACTATGTNTVRPPGVSSSQSSGVVDVAVVAGSVPGFADGKGTAARFREPNGIDIDASGNIFVADTGNHRIRKVSTSGVVSTLAGGERGFKDGSASEARFDSPYGVCVDGNGTVFVADTKNHRIRAIASDGNVSTVAGGPSAGDRDGAADAARFNLPFSIALDALGGLIVADTGNHRIRRIDVGRTVETLVGQGPGYKDSDISGALFNAPSDLSLDARGRVYVADLRNQAIREIDLIGGQIRTVAGNGVAAFEDGPQSEARFNMPTGLSVGPTGMIYVADSQNRALRLVTPEGRTFTLARFGVDGLSSIVPMDLAVDSNDHIYATDAARGQVVKLK